MSNRHGAGAEGGGICHPSTRWTFDACQDEVKGIMSAGESFGSVKATIESAKITEDERAAF
jgi:hypothetical protein